MKTDVSGTINEGTFVPTDVLLLRVMLRVQPFIMVVYLNGIQIQDVRSKPTHAI